MTPYIAHAVAQKAASRPDDGFAYPSDPASVLLGMLNRIYGVNGVLRVFPIMAISDSFSTDLPRKETTMQTVRTMIAESRCGIAGLAVRAVFVAGCALLVCGCNTDQEQIDERSRCSHDYRRSSDHDKRSRPHPRTLHRLQSRLAQCDGTRGCACIRPDLEAGSHRRRR